MRVLALTLLLAASAASAQDPDADALDLADRTGTEARSAGDWRAFVEGALIGAAPRSGGSTQHAQRLSVDVHYEKAFAPQWRFVFADRLDLTWRGAPTYDDFINTLKEVYVSWQPHTDLLFDLGRVNQRYGVATGYNPTDYFRADAVRSVVSINPVSLRENRLGTAMVRGQTLWPGGSLTALYAPKLADEPNDSPFSPDFGATNNRNQWLIAFSHKLTDDLSPQLLLYDSDRSPPQLGLNVTTLLSDAVVGYLEYSGGRSTSLAAQALALPEDPTFRSRLATGVTYTAPIKLSVTLEYQYNGAGADQAEWDALRQGPPSVYAQYRQFAARQQDLPTTQNAFLYARWPDAGMPRLDLSAMLRYDILDHSYLSWLEARYHWSQIDLALQWQRNVGTPTSQYGALESSWIWQLVLTYFF